MGNGFDRLTLLVMLVLVAAIIEVVAPGTIEGLARQVLSSFGLA